MASAHTDIIIKTHCFSLFPHEWPTVLDLHTNLLPHEWPYPFCMMPAWIASLMTTVMALHYFGWHPHEWPSPAFILMSTWSALADGRMNGPFFSGWRPHDRPLLMTTLMAPPLWVTSAWSALADDHINGPSALDDVRMNGPAACAGNARQWGDEWLQLLLKRPQVSLSNIYMYAQNCAATMKKGVNYTMQNVHSSWLMLFAAGWLAWVLRLGLVTFVASQRGSITVRTGQVSWTFGLLLRVHSCAPKLKRRNTT